MTKLCIDCKHSNKIFVVWCEHPSLPKQLSDGKVIPIRCDNMRRKYVGTKWSWDKTLTTTCGEEGDLFEPKPSLKDKIWHILKLN